MAKFKAAEGVTGISVGGDFFPVDGDGCIDVPDSYGAAIAPHGFVPYVAPDPSPRKGKSKPDQE